MLETGILHAELGACAGGKGTIGSVLYDEEAGGLDDSRGDLTIRLADTGNERDLAASILNRMYGRSGYGSHHQIAETNHAVTFTACSDGELVGTLTLAVDSQARLALDDTFPEELRQFRAQPGGSLCELTKFAFDPSPYSRPLLAKLFHTILLYGTQRYDCTDLLIEVDPRHIRFYEVMLRFSRVGPMRINPRVDAPGQLMHLKVADIRKNVERRESDAGVSGRSLYRYFFDHETERQVNARIAALHGKSQPGLQTRPARPRFGIDLGGPPLLQSIRSVLQKKRAAA